MVGIGFPGWSDRAYVHSLATDPICCLPGLCAIPGASAAARARACLASSREPGLHNDYGLAGPVLMTRPRVLGIPNTEGVG